MATITVSLPADGDTVDAADYNTPITTIVGDYNGGITNDNISASAAIVSSKLAGEITNDKILTNLLGKVFYTSNQTTITSEVDLTGLSVTVTVPAGGRYVKISGLLSGVAGSNANNKAVLTIQEDATVLGFSYLWLSDVYASSLYCICVLTPAQAAAGSHTYKLALERTNGTGTLTNYANSELIVELI